MLLAILLVVVGVRAVFLQFIGVGPALWMLLAFPDYVLSYTRNLKTKLVNEKELWN